MAENNNAPAPGEETTNPNPDGFKPIETQEAFDALIKDRIERVQNAVRKEYQDFETYKSKAEDYETKMNEFTKQITDLTAERDQLKGEISKRETAAEKSRIAREYGLPESLADRLTGSKKEDWEEDAKALAALFKDQRPPYPQPNPADPIAENSDLLRLAREL